MLSLVVAVFKKSIQTNACQAFVTDVSSQTNVKKEKKQRVMYFIYITVKNLSTLSHTSSLLKITLVQSINYQNRFDIYTSNSPSSILFLRNL